jgi:uroporphyrinogen-III decarboxylase
MWTPYSNRPGIERRHNEPSSSKAITSWSAASASIYSSALALRGFKDNSPYELKPKYGGKITFWGGLGSQSIIPFGTPDAIKIEVARLCREMGHGGGYILGPAKEFQPETPTGNAAAVVEAFLQQAGVPFP